MKKSIILITTSLAFSLTLSILGEFLLLGFSYALVGVGSYSPSAMSWIFILSFPFIILFSLGLFFLFSKKEITANLRTYGAMLPELLIILVVLLGVSVVLVFIFTALYIAAVTVFQTRVALPIIQAFYNYFTLLLLVAVAPLYLNILFTFCLEDGKKSKRIKKGFHVGVSRYFSYLLVLIAAFGLDG